MLMLNNLNTSHVNVNPCKNVVDDDLNDNLNTSHVNVNQSKERPKTYTSSFKYISC